MSFGDDREGDGEGKHGRVRWVRSEYNGRGISSLRSTLRKGIGCMLSEELDETKSIQLVEVKIQKERRVVWKGD